MFIDMLMQTLAVRTDEFYLLPANFQNQFLAV